MLSWRQARHDGTGGGPHRQNPVAHHPLSGRRGTSLVHVINTGMLGTLAPGQWLVVALFIGLICDGNVEFDSGDNDKDVQGWSAGVADEDR